MKALAIRVLVCGLGLVGALSVQGCGSSADSKQEGARLGSVNLALTGVGSSGTQYRLTAATFTVSGPKNVTLLSDTAPDAASIRQELPAGNYLIKLKTPGWTLQQMTGMGFVPVNAVLTSVNPAGFAITDQGLTTVAFTFNAGPDVVQLGDGTLDVVINVNDGQCPMGLTLCNGMCAPSCGPVSCMDGVKDGPETDVDCGGMCPQACSNGKSCVNPGDCASQFCVNGVCQATQTMANCMDGVKNGAETDIDCGGMCPQACVNGAGCASSSDCASGICLSGICQATPNCMDGVTNGGESDVDCGGMCPSRCADAKKCQSGNDCQSAVCTMGLCASATCSDTAKNGTETDVDCGGVCAACAVGKSCGSNADCQSRVCVGGLCQAPTCSDMVKNGTEVDTDCGGSCAGCPIGKSCNSPLDCQSLLCVGNICH